MGNDYKHFKATPADLEKLDPIEEQKEGVVSCLRFSPDGNHLAAGDRAGTLRIYDSRTNELICKRTTPDTEFVALDYSPCPEENGGYILAAGSKEGYVHVYNEDYDIVN